MIDELYITDGTDANTIVLHGNEAGLRVKSWDPLILPFKGGGVWNDNPFVEGKVPVMAVEDDVADSFNLTATGGTQDSLIRVLRELRRVLSLAVSYWNSDIGIRPVYLKKRANCETNYTYTVIKSWATPDDPDPFNNPFISTGGSGNSSDSDLILVVTHGSWLGNPPGLGTCVPVDGQIFYAKLSGTNLVVNGGFETAGGGGADVFGTWTETAGTGTIVRDTVEKRTGAASAKLTGGVGAVAELRNQFSVIKGTHYYWEFYYKTPVATAQVFIYDVTNSIGIAGTLATLPASPAGYTRYFGEFTTAANCNTILVYLSSPTANGTVINYDDVYLAFYQSQYMGNPPVCRSNLIYNGDFEYGPSTAIANNWTLSAGTLTSILRDTGDKFTGAYSVKFTAGAGGQSGFIVTAPGITYPSKRKYKITARFKVVANGSFIFDTKLVLGGVTTFLYSSRSLSTPGWDTHSWIIDYPDGGLALQVGVTFTSTGAGSGYVDAFEMVPIDNYSPAFAGLLNAPSAVLSGTSRIQLTHVFLDEAGTFSDNLLNHGFPFNLFKGGSVANITYFGADSTIPDNSNLPSALFMSLSNADITGIDVTWQYWNGAAWTAFTDFGGNGVLGISSMGIFRNGPVNYEFNALTSPAVTTVNGVLGWWIRAVPGAWLGTGYVQAVDFNPYFPNKPFVKIPAAGLRSEMPLIADLRFAPLGPNGEVQSFSRFAIATRSVSRGANFNPIIPFTSKGQETGINLSLNALTYVADLTAPSGEKANFNSIQSGISISLSSPLTAQYNGRFRAIVRVKQNGGAVGDITSTFTAGPGAVVYPGALIPAIGVNAFFDYGIVSIPGFDIEPGEYTSTLTMFVGFARSTGAGTMDVFDLILIPVDEFYADVRPVTAASTWFTWTNQIGGMSSLEPRKSVKGFASNEVGSGWLETVLGGQVISSAEFTLLPRTDQFLIIMPISQTAGRRISTRLELFAAPRFYNMRGDL